MAAELGLLSLTQLQSFLVQSQKQPQLINHSATSAGCPWMWNPKQAAAAAATAAVQDHDEDSWEERAFEEDSSNVTWPPRSYTCTFCRREFRSAQALGGHMNVHRRDRARLHQTLLPGSSNPAAMVGTSSGPSTLLIPTQDFVGNGGLCFLYSIPNPSGAFTPTAMNTCINSPPNLSPVTQNSVDNLISTNPPSNNFLVNPLSINSSVNHIGNLEPSTSFTNDNSHGNSRNMNNSSTEELDLELRLGRGRSSPT